MAQISFHVIPSPQPRVDKVTEATQAGVPGYFFLIFQNCATYHGQIVGLFDSRLLLEVDIGGRFRSDALLLPGLHQLHVAGAQGPLSFACG